MSKPYIELYIDKKLVEFKEPPKVLITYSHQDLHNPTIVKNSFSKTVNIEGTPHNNQIFGDFYDMTRITGYDNVSLSGAYFNASKKVPFELYRNGEIMEQGYVKLDKVKKKGNYIQYDITLYGGLGEFLYNLQYNEDGEQMKLSDLDYGGGDKEFDFEVNRNVVADAWEQVNKVAYKNELYDKINFAPCYNGIPKDFSADKVAIDLDSIESTAPELYEKLVKDKPDEYDTVNGWILGELSKEYDEIPANDYRSYLQRPVFRFKNIIQACCKPENNGGYTVDLDEEFFSDSNNYYDNAWITLPMLNELEVESVESNVILSMDSDGYIIANGVQDGTNLTFSLPMHMMATVPYSMGIYDKLYTGMQTMLKPSKRTIREGKVEGYNAARYAQFVVYNRNNIPVNGSTIYSFHSSILQCDDFVYEPEYPTTIQSVTGEYINVGRSGEYVDADDYVFNNSIYFLKLSNIEWKDGYYIKLVVKTAENNRTKSNENVGADYLYNQNIKTKSGSTPIEEDETIEKVYWYSRDTQRLIGEYYNVPIESKIPKSEVKVNKKRLLNSEKTPCDYFLGYLKMFNLHIWKDMYEKKIYVRQRKNYFHYDRYDLEGVIDRGADISITPLTFENKWLNFNIEQVDSSIAKEYLDNYGIDYGMQKIDTNYNFDNSSMELFESSVFKGAIQCRKKSRYYTVLMENDNVLPTFILDGVQTLFFNEDGETGEGAVFKPDNSAMGYNLWKEKYYDLFPKPVFADDKNESVEGANVLLFYNGFIEPYSYSGDRLALFISDDIDEFETLNDGEPCWIWSKDDSKVIFPEYIPMFSRYITNKNGWITHSWDFGTPKTLYIPDYNIDDNSNLYTQYWKPYIRDMYNVDTRIIECNVLLKERVVGDWLQRFYYFDGTYWILYRITDYDVTSNDTTKCEFVRVQDINNYLI